MVISVSLWIAVALIIFRSAIATFTFPVIVAKVAPFARAEILLMIAVTKPVVRAPTPRAVLAAARRLVPTPLRRLPLPRPPLRNLRALAPPGPFLLLLLPMTAVIPE